MSASNGSRTDWKSSEWESPSALPTSPNPDPLLTAEQLAERWQVPVAHVYRLVRRGDLDAVKLGRYRRFAVAAIDSFERSGGTEGSEDE